MRIIIAEGLCAGPRGGEGPWKGVDATLRDLCVQCKSFRSAEFRWSFENKQINKSLVKGNPLYKEILYIGKSFIPGEPLVNTMGKR